MDAVGGDQQRAIVSAGRLTRRLVDEVGAHAVRGLGPPDEVMTGKDVLPAQSLGRGIEQDLLQRAAVDGELRPFVAGFDAARLAPDRFAVF
jgi:hypothetical protein